MIVRVPDLTEEVRHVAFSEPAEALNEAVDAHPGWTEQHFDGPVEVEGELYKTGSDVHFSGKVRASFVCSCSRCLDEYRTELDRGFRFVIVAGQSDDDDDVGLDHYDGDELDLSRLVREQAMLAVAGAGLCSEDCRGLCPSCGANLNHEECRCLRQ